MMRVVAATGLIVLSGCGEAAYLSYQGRPAETALECQAAYQEAQTRGTGVDYSSGASVVGSAIGSGIADGLIESAYNSCLARVAALPAPAGGAAPAPVPRATSRAPAVRAPSSVCVAGGGPMQGGTGYCRGY